MKSLSFLAELYLRVQGRGEGGSWMSSRGPGAGLYGATALWRWWLPLKGAGRGPRPFLMRRTRATPGPTDSLSSNDVHSKAKCILHSVRLALQGREGAQHQLRPVPAPRPPACSLYSRSRGSRPFLGFTLANLMASPSLSRALWKYATCGDSGGAWSSLLGVSSSCPHEPCLAVTRPTRRPGSWVPASPSAGSLLCFLSSLG